MNRPHADYTADPRTVCAMLDGLIGRVTARLDYPGLPGEPRTAHTVYWTQDGSDLPVATVWPAWSAGDDDDTPLPPTGEIPKTTVALYRNDPSALLLAALVARTAPSNLRWS